MRIAINYAIITAILICGGLIPSAASAATPLHWQSLATGLDYTVIYPSPTMPLQKIHAFRIDLKKYKLTLILAKNYQKKSIFVNQVAQNINALIAINGGFFSPQSQPLGLRINSGKVLHPLKNTSWWGVFIVKNSRAMIVPKSGFRYSKNIQFAIQAGPRLIVNGTIPKLRENVANRSALGVTRNGNVIIVATQNLALSTTQLASIMQRPEKQGGLACYNGLNLDGGNSSQLYAHVGNFNLKIQSFRPVTDVIVVTQRQ